jgi:hypothetical protein
LLDVGAAAGLILDGLVKEGFNGCGVEPNETMARFAQTEIRLDVTAAAFEDFEPGNAIRHRHGHSGHGTFH